jgi:cytochrome b
MKHPIWDLPTRVFHWLLVIGIIAAWLTYENDQLLWHSRIGFTLLALIIFRLLWGFVGSIHSRFSDFKLSPKSLIHYLKTGQTKPQGHNPLGSLSVLALLTLITSQILTGLFNSDDLMFDGPYRALVDTDTADAIAEWHAQIFDILLIFIAVHLLAVLYHQIIKKAGIIQAMITGYNQKFSGENPATSLWIALLCVCISILTVSVLIVWYPNL